MKRIKITIETDEGEKHVYDVTASGIQYVAELMTLGVSIATLPETQWNR